MKKKASINYFFPTLLFIIFIFAGLTSFLQLFGFCAAHFDVLADSLVLAIVFCLVYMFVCVELAKAAERYIDDSWWLAEKYGVSDPRVVTSARVLTLIGALLCGIVYWKTKNLLATLVGEVFGTAVLGGLCAYPVAIFLMGKSAADIAFYAYIVPFLISTAGGAVIAAVILVSLKKAGALSKMQASLAA